MARSRNAGLRALMGIAITVLTVGINVFFYSAVVYGIKYVANYSYDFAYRVFGETRVEEAPGRNVKVTILKGEGSMDIAKKLEDAKVIEDRYSFYLKLKLKEYDIMPGTFQLNTSMTYDEVLETLVAYSSSLEKEKSLEDVEAAQ